MKSRQEQDSTWTLDLDGGKHELLEHRVAAIAKGLDREGRLSGAKFTMPGGQSLDSSWHGDLVRGVPAGLIRGQVVKDLAVRGAAQSGVCRDCNGLRGTDGKCNC